MAKKHTEVPRPPIVKMYYANGGGGGVDVANRMISYYRVKSRVKKWTIWSEWPLTIHGSSTQRTFVLKFLDFHHYVAEILVAQVIAM